MKKNTKSTLLKSVVTTTLSIASISPIAIALGKQIADEQQNKLLNNISKQIQNWDNIQNMNVATNNMFQNTENISSLSSLGRGQMVTPYGWLGTYSTRTAINPGANQNSDSAKDFNNNTLVLVGWDGSIIWTNNDSPIAIYSAKYDFKNDVIFVTRTQDPSGAGGHDANLQPTTDPNESYKVALTIHDAKTGKILYDGQKQQSLWNFKGLFDDNRFHWDQYNKRDLYYQDMVTFSNGDILWLWTPNYNKLRNDATTLSEYIQLMTGSKSGVNNNADINKNYYKALIIKKSDIDDVRAGKANAKITPIDWVGKHLGQNAIFYSVWIGYPIIFPPTFFVKNNSLYSIDYCINTNDGKVYRSTAEWTYNPNNNDISYTRTAWWEVYFYAVDRTNFSMLKKNDWDSQHYNENSFLLPTRNMFDQNIVTIPYPAYANIDPTKNFKLPIFNVLQAHGETYTDVNPSLLDIRVTGPKCKEFNFGDKIYRHYKNNNLSTIDPTTISNSSPLLWYPWPAAISSTTGHAYLFDNYSNQLYSRLISVSPFDNTIVYASRPNVYSQSSISGDDYAGGGSNTKYYGSFWIGNSSDGKISNFILSNGNLSQYGSSVISSNLVTNSNNGAAINTLYKTGFWFDINSNSNSSNNNKVNLYFLSAGNWKNYHIPSTDNSVKSTAIVLMNPSTNTKFDMNNVTSTKTTEKNFVKLDNSRENDIVNYVTSRADLNLWFNRTYQNLTRGANAYQNNTLLNDYDINNQNRAVATQFNTKLNTAGFFGANNKSVELFSLWKTGSESYSALPVKRAKIVTKIDTNQVATNALNVELQFILANINTLNNQFIETTDKDKVTTFTYPVTISNASWQLMDSWSTNVKLDSFSQNPDTNEFNTSLKIVGDTNPTQGKYGTNFGTHNLGYWTRVGNNGNYNYTWNGVNGNILNNNTDTPLWVEFGIDYDPNKNANADWKHSLESYENGLFKKTYPAGSSLPAGATSFNEVLDKFIKWKAANLMYENSTSNPTNNIYSPGQICIKAYLKINPHFTKNSSNTTLYSMPLDGGVEVQVLYDSTNDIRYVYRDEYKGNRVVYKQTSSEWDQNKQYGFGSLVTNDITNSWVAIPNSQIFTAYLKNGTNVKNVLVRDTNVKTDQMFSAKYSQDGNSIILTIKDGYVDWAKQRFSSYNQMVGRYIKFQYLSVAHDNVSESWKDFNSNVITDTTGKNMFDSNNSYTIPFKSTDGSTLPNNLQKVRFALYSLPTSDPTYNPNKIIASNELVSNPEFLSDAITLDQIPLHVDYNWLNDVELTVNTTDSYLNGPTNKQIDKTLLTSTLNAYQTTVINKSVNIDNFKSLLKLTYSLDNKTFVDADQVYDLLKAKWEWYNDANLGIICLYDNRNTNTTFTPIKIHVKFAMKDQANVDKYDIVEKNVDKNFVNRTNIKYFINLSEYKNVLETTKTSVIRGNTENSIQSFTPPDMTGTIGTGFLYHRSFEEITKVLAKFGITVEYQKNDSSHAWTSNKNEITSYDPNTREIKMRFVISTNANLNVVASTDGTNIFSPNSNEISLKLNVPILVDLKDNVKNNFISKDHISGNTWQITIDDAKDKSIITDIKTDGDSGANPTDKPIWQTLDQYLEVQYALSTDKNPTNVTFYNRQDFINNLKSANTTNYNNTVWARLHLKNQGQDVKFVLTSNASTPFKMNNDTSHPNRNKVLIYVQSKEYESAANNISVSGSTGNLIFTYPEPIQKLIGNINNNFGVKIQYSLKQNITYGDTSTTGDIKQSWVDTAPTSVPVGTQSVKVRITVTDSSKYVYGKANENTAEPTVHSIDLNNIASLIDVDSVWFNQEPLTIANNGYLKDINASDIDSWKDKILNKSKALQADASLKAKVEIKYQIEGEQNWHDANALIAQLKSMMNNYSDQNLGIIYLWDGFRGIKINAKFEKKTEADKVVFVDTTPGSTTANANLEGQVKTDQIKTYIDFSSYVTVLTTTKTKVVLQNGQPGTIQSFIPPAMTNGNGFLNGKSFDEIATRLKALGITFTFNDGMAGSAWNTKENVTTYNKTNPILDLGFKYDNANAPKITFKLNSTRDISATTEEANLVRLQLLAPITIQVDLTQLDQLKFEGNTKTISNASTITTNIQTIINNVKASLTTSNIDHNDLNLEIRFSLNNLKLEETVSDADKSDDGIWFTFDKLSSILSNSTTNYNTNAIYAKYYIKNNPKIDNVDKYLLSNSNSQNINQENLTTDSQFKVYINNTEQTKEPWITQNLKLSGSQDNFTINGLEAWINGLPKGLSVQYNNKVSTNNTNAPDENNWKDTLADAKPIDTLRNFWIRFKVGPAYVFESAETNNASYSKAFKLDASQIQVALKVQSTWLNQITLTGNLKELQIDEAQAIQQVTSANMMPVPNIIHIEYTYDDTNWYIKDTFKAKLQEASGAKDATNWIILRENIKARFSIDPSINNKQDPKYLLEVDNTNVNEDNSNNINIQLITNTHNNTVKGYINLDKFTSYKASNFNVTGTNDQAYLNIQNYNNLNTLLSPYSSSNLFSILYKWEKNATYDVNNKVWTPGQDLTGSMALNGTYSARYFGMQFKIDDTNYELYKDNTKQTTNTYEYSTDATDNANKIDIKISVAIENPLEANDITIKFLTANNEAQWYNEAGAFNIQISKPASGGTGTQIFNSFKDFLDKWSSLLQDQKDALELVYYVANEGILEETEYQKAIGQLSVYDTSNTSKYNVWRTVSDQTAVDQLNYNLKVNDYVILAVRIKQDKLTSETNPNGYVLKDNKHNPTSATRVFGYKVHTSDIDVDWTSLKVRNVDAAETASYGLDGYAMLDQLSLKRAANATSANSEDYLNVSLQLNYYTEFYEKPTGTVLVSGDGSRLVKRSTTNSETDGYYKDADGNQITDASGNPIPILYQAGQKDKGILAKPIKANTIQRSHDLVETTTNNYTLELTSGENNALYSFFKFQDISIKFTNKKGLADPANPNVFDYYVDQKDVLKEHVVDSQIKFPIENNNLIRYTFNSEEFINFIKDPNNISAVYENTTNAQKSPVNGQSKIKYMYKVTRTANNAANPETLTTVQEIMQRISTDFGQKVILKTTYTPVNGTIQVLTNNDLSSITTLSNGDRFRIEIVSSDENNLIFAQQPSPLVFTISGLYEADIDEEYLQYLRVQQSGNFNGEGKFEIFVDNPYDDADNHIPVSTLLQSYKFMVRIWDSTKNVKHDWTTDYESINNLTNGDKVEWKLVAPTGSPVEKAYYNTVANMDKHNANDKLFSFSQVAKIGNASTVVVANTIGQNPTTDAYPEDSGFLISGLEDKISDTYTTITEEEFLRLMNIINFGYTGINGQGNMISERDINTITVNTSGLTRQEYTFKYLVDQGYLTFFSNDVEFTWNQVKDNNGNWLISPGTLSNGDQIKIKYQDPTMSSAYVWEAPEVSGLKDKSDSMSLLAYVGIGMASFVTLGIFALVYFRARNKKLRK